MNIKENSLQENVTTDPNVLENQFVRWVTNKITGASQLKKVSGLILKISNILGLQTALDSKNQLPAKWVSATGQGCRKRRDRSVFY